MNEQQQAFLLQLARQISTVLAACEENGSAEIILGSNRQGNKMIQVRLVAEKKYIPAQFQTTH
jgi:hypothetical protein